MLLTWAMFVVIWTAHTFARNRYGIDEVSTHNAAPATDNRVGFCTR